MNNDFKVSGWLAYVGPMPFPWGQAGSRRIYGMARSLAMAGYDVRIGSCEREPVEITKLENVGSGSISYVGLAETPPLNSSLFTKLLSTFISQGTNTLEWLASQESLPAAVFLYGGGAQYARKVLRWCKKNKVPLIADVVEWYDPRQLIGGRLGPFYWSSQLALRYFYPRCDGVIAISSWLERHYLKFDQSVVRIPPTIDTSKIPKFESSHAVNTRLNLFYAGSPGKKDLLATIIAAVEKVDPSGTKIELKVLGPNKEEVFKLTGASQLPRAVTVLGRVPQHIVAEHLAKADFTVLLREPLKFTNAGFPTKFVESMAAGIPVIANLTSDIGFYLHDGVEGLISADYSVNGFADAVSRALDLTPEHLRTMRSAARVQAQKSFDCGVYAAPLQAFLEHILSKRQMDERIKSP